MLALVQEYYRTTTAVCVKYPRWRIKLPQFTFSTTDPLQILASCPIGRSWQLIIQWIKQISFWYTRYCWKDFSRKRLTRRTIYFRFQNHLYSVSARWFICNVVPTSLYAPSKLLCKVNSFIFMVSLIFEMISSISYLSWLGRIKNRFPVYAKCAIFK